MILLSYFEESIRTGLFKPEHFFSVTSRIVSPQYARQLTHLLPLFATYLPKIEPSELIPNELSPDSLGLIRNLLDVLLFLLSVVRYSESVDSASLENESKYGYAAEEHRIVVQANALEAVRVIQSVLKDDRLEVLLIVGTIEFADRWNLFVSELNRVMSSLEECPPNSAQSPFLASLKSSLATVEGKAALLAQHKVAALADQYCLKTIGIDRKLSYGVLYCLHRNVCTFPGLSFEQL